jgi:hypothetical protein
LKKSVKKLLFALVLLGTQLLQAQFFKENFYYEGEIGCISSFFVTDAEGETKIFSVGGLSFRGGLGVHDGENIVFLGIHSGIEGNFRHNTGILPLYLNSKVAIPVSEKGRLIFSFGYGKSFHIGHENLKGYLRKYTIAVSTITKKDNMDSFFIEINNHGFNFPDNGIRATTLNFGYTYTFL